MTTFNWLHLSDLHLGMAEQVPLLPAIEDRFFEDLKLMHDKCGPWDFVLFTGDLTYKGSKEEFKLLDEFLERLWDHLAQLGTKKPLLLAVPGNHDLVRPVHDLPEVLLLRDWSDKSEVRSAFWWKEDSRYRNVVNEAFANYVEWWDRTPLKPATQSGMLPGDFSAVVQKSGASLGIVGLNSAFLQLTEGDYKEKLAINAAQFQQVCEGSGPKWVKKHNACLLLTHQPPDWLTPDARKELQGEIVGNDYFAAHVFGHMHGPGYESSSKGGASTIRTCQGTALFGFEYEKDEKLDRRHGYSAAQIKFDNDKGTFVQWPRKAHRPDDQWNFAADNDYFKLTEDNHTQEEEVTLLKPLAVYFRAESLIREDPGEGGMEAELEIERPFPNQWAVLVGVTDYEDAAKLKYCRQDVIDLARAFRESLGFQNVFEFHEEADLKPERDKIFRKLGDIRDEGKVKPDDLFVFYFSGHGINEGGVDYLLPIGARPRDVGTLGIKVQEVAKYLQAIGCKNTAMFIDACREGLEGPAKAAGTPSVGEESKTILKDAGIIAFFSCDPKDRSYEIDPLQHGSFTYCLLTAIQEGSAETVSELENYLKVSVPQLNLKFGRNTQQPYAVIPPPPDQANLQIFFNPQRRLQTEQKFEPLLTKFMELFDGGKAVLEQLEFIGRIKTKKQLDDIEKNKLALIESLCADRMELAFFLRLWNKARPRELQIKKPEGLIRPKPLGKRAQSKSQKPDDPANSD